MFHRFARHHSHDRHECHHCHEEDGGHHRRSGRHLFAGRGGEEHGRGGRGRHRLFEHGELRLVLLALVERNPSHGYELIKAIEEASSGLYVPSPGVIYPTLTLLEEQDFLAPANPGNGRKSYQITDLGKQELQKHQGAIEMIFARLASTGQHRRHEGNLAEGISETMHRLRYLLRGNMVRTDLTQEQVERINQALLTAVEAIEAEMVQPEQPQENR
ncbi:PadR family transcriptional regulator [Serratia sp. L9]|uniref:PadR family transcriptional regulator n=1 Tax=Serratia sp. L9 TaxID=3423946 RepID=UPI003D66A6D3